MTGPGAALPLSPLQAGRGGSGSAAPRTSRTDFGCCGVYQGDHSKEPVRVDVTEVFPEGCHQLARGCGSMDAVESSQVGR